MGEPRAFISTDSASKISAKTTSISINRQAISKASNRQFIFAIDSFSLALWHKILGKVAFGVAMPTSYHMVHYRRFDTPGSKLGSNTLELLCRTALGQTNGAGMSLWERAEDRLLDLGDGRQTMLNKTADLASAVFGEMCLVQSQGFQALLEQQASKVKLSNLTIAEIFKLDERSAPRGSKFIRGMAYWLAVGNHFFFVKTQSMSADLVHGYIDWLLKTRTSALASNVSFKLQAEFDKAQLAGDIGDIRSLRVSGVSLPQIAVAPPKDGQKKTRTTTRKIADRFVMFEQARAVVEAVFGKPKTEALVASLGPDEVLAVDTAIKIQGKRTEESREQMKAIASGLADLTEGKVQVEGKDGKISDDDAILRTRMPFELAHEGSNFLDFDNVADQLQEVYSRFVRDRKIVA